MRQSLNMRQILVNIFNYFTLFSVKIANDVNCSIISYIFSKMRQLANPICLVKIFV